LLRHASAGVRQLGSVADLARPLDAGGAADAGLLAALLASYGRCRVVSSAAERCLATVQPYAQAASVPVEVDRDLTLGSTPDWTGSAQRAAELAIAGEPVIICAHRENLPAMIEAACAALHAGPPAGPPLDKGSFVVLQSDDGVLRSWERQDLGD
jgi:phosphohistidine phosphatase SixA